MPDSRLVAGVHAIDPAVLHPVHTPTPAGGAVDPVVAGAAAGLILLVAGAAARFYLARSG